MNLYSRAEAGRPKRRSGKSRLKLERGKVAKPDGEVVIRFLTRACENDAHSLCGNPKCGCDCHGAAE